jgi:hypothetical protein
MAEIITIGKIKQTVMFKKAKGDIGQRKFDRLNAKLDKWESMKEVSDKEEYFKRIE